MAKKSDVERGRLLVLTNQAARGLPEMVASLVQMGSGHSSYKDIDVRITQNHHKAFWNKVGSHFDMSPIGDFGPFGQKTVYIPPFGVGWCMVR